MENHPVGIDVPASGYSESVRYAMAKHARYSLGVHRGVISSPDKPQRSWDELDEEERASLVRFARTIEKGFRELGYKFEYVNPPVAWHPSEAEFNYLALRNYLWRSVEYTHGGGYKEWSELSPRSQQDFQEEVRETLDTLFDAGLSVVPIERDGM
ncbi:MAG: hypothetical protein SWE60_11710 [Thermodesulfobacteriota bacterium]|nr:hypothetical protein [Thermodesulfobacteriota bacterium]